MAPGNPLAPRLDGAGAGAGGSGCVRRSRLLRGRGWVSGAVHTRPSHPKLRRFAAATNGSHTPLKKEWNHSAPLPGASRHPRKARTVTLRNLQSRSKSMPTIPNGGPGIRTQKSLRTAVFKTAAIAILPTLPNPRNLDGSRALCKRQRHLRGMTHSSRSWLHPYHTPQWPAVAGTVAACSHHIGERGEEARRATYAGGDGAHHEQGSDRRRTSERVCSHVPAGTRTYTTSGRQRRPVGSGGRRHPALARRDSEDLDMLGHRHASVLTPPARSLHWGQRRSTVNAIRHRRARSSGSVRVSVPGP